MGTSFSSSNHGVAVWVSQPVFSEGDVVEGYALINATEAIEATTVSVELVGREQASWDEVTEERSYDEHAQEWREEKRTQYRTSSKDFFKICAPIYTFPNGTCQPGQYQLPFRFTLPDGVPGTFAFRDNYSTQGAYTYQNLLAEVVYELKAEVHRAGKSLQGSTVLNVQQRMTRAPEELVSEATQRVTSCCCMGQGHVRMRVRLAKDAYVAGETAEVLLEVENSSELSFSEVDVKVVREVQLAASSSTYSDEDTVVKLKCPGLAKGASYTGERAQRLAVPLPAGLLPTTRGELVTCAYGVVVELSAGSFASAAKLKVPVTIYTPAPPHPPYASAPPDFWKPAVIGAPVDLALPGAGPAALAPPPVQNPMYAKP